MIARIYKALRRRLRAKRALAAARDVSLARVRKGGIKRVLVVCYGNIYRSPFAGVSLRQSLPAQIESGTRAVVLEMHRLISMDTSGLDALQQLHRTLQSRDVALVLANVNEQPLSLIRRSGFEHVLGAEQIVPTVSAAFNDAPGWHEGH